MVSDGSLENSADRPPVKLRHASRLRIGTPITTGMPRSIAIAIRSSSPAAFGFHLAELVQDQQFRGGIERTRHLRVHLGERRHVQPAPSGARATVFEQIGPQARREFFQRHLAMTCRIRSKPDAAARRPLEARACGNTPRWLRRLIADRPRWRTRSPPGPAKAARLRYAAGRNAAHTSGFTSIRRAPIRSRQ